MVQREAFDLVQGQQHSAEERLVLLLEGQREAVDDRAEDLEQLGDAVVALGVVAAGSALHWHADAHEVEEDVVDRPADEGAQVEELAVDAVQRRLEEVALTRVLAVEQLEQLQHKVGVDVALGDVRVEVGRLDESARSGRPSAETHRKKNS